MMSIKNAGWDNMEKTTPLWQLTQKMDQKK
jgi:hypothetical protein